MINFGCFKNYFQKIILHLNVDYTVEKHTALPNDEDTFMRLFYDETTENVKNINLFKMARIMGS